MKQIRPVIAVYCSSRGDLPEEVTDGTQLIITTAAQCNAALVYGGVNAGLMHTVAQTAADKGMPITGIVPEIFQHRADPLCHEIILAKDLNDRKGRMIAMADIFIVLPGGLGTIDEWISTLSDIMVRERVNPAVDRPILVWNHNGMYNGIADQLDSTANSIYARGKRVDRSHIFHSATDMAEYLRTLITT